MGPRSSRSTPRSAPTPGGSANGTITTSPSNAKSTQTGGLLGQISQGHHYFGFNRGELYGKPGVWYREWAPGRCNFD